MEILKTWTLVMVVSTTSPSPVPDEVMFKECQRAAQFLQTTYLPLASKDDPKVRVHILCSSKK